LVYWFILAFVVQYRDEDSFTCVEQDKKTGKFIVIEGVTSAINTACVYVMGLHLVCFILLVTAANYVPKTITTNSNVIKLFLGFVTVPMYIFMILWLESALEDDRMKFEWGTPGNF
jgi:hypothetical protein